MLRALMIGGFGFIGTLSRYYLQGLTQRLTQGTFPYGTLAVNVLGSLTVGFVAALTLERVAMNPAWRSAIEIADRAERIQAFLPALDEMVADGLVTLERVQVITYRPGKDAPKT